MMKTSIVLLLFILVTCVAFSQPTITSFSPASGPVGTTVTISGSNFNNIAANNTVFFGAVKASVKNSSSSSLTVSVPAGATYQPITVTNNSLTAYSKKPFILTFPKTEPGFTTASFVGVLDSITGASPYDIVRCDIDGDGKTDILTANHLAGTFSVHKNISSGTVISLASKLDFTTGKGPYGIAVADIDGDGKPDVVVTNYLDDNISVFRNTSQAGNISFASAVNFATGNGPEHVAIYDLDSDGKPDLTVANFLDNTVSLLRNIGSDGIISFDPKVHVILTLAPKRLAVGDLDADGKPDVAVTCELSDGVRILQNQSSKGSFNFVPGFTFITGRRPNGICIGDLDGDDIPDVAVSNSLSNQFTGLSTFSILRNISSSGNIKFVKTDITTNGDPSDIGLSDLNGDGKTDIAIASGAGYISLFNNASSVGNISFDTSVNYPASFPFRLTIADMNSDDKADLVNSSALDKVYILRNRLNEMAITSITPTSIGSGGMVTINGANFTDITAVKFGGVAATSFTVINRYTITAIVGKGNSGSVSVTNAAGYVSYPGFVFIGPPEITSIIPNKAGYGDTVTISGNNFSGLTEVSFGGKLTAFINVSPTAIKAIIGDAASGDVTVTTQYGTAKFPGFNYIPTPVITSFTPVQAGQGTVISISGYNFLGTTAVSFGGVAAESFVIVSPTTITAVPGSGASGDVSIITAYGKSKSPGFIFLPAPTITSFTPMGGFDGTIVTVKGTNFNNVTHVTVGGTSYDVSFKLISSIEIQIPINPLGASGSIVITTPGGMATMPGFVFNPQPVVNSISPSEAGTGMTVEIVGANFTGATSVTFGGVPASSFKINSPTSISAIVGSGSIGNVIVTNSYGVNVWSPPFTFTKRPIIASFSPESGPVGTLITIKGGNFSTTPTDNHVYFGAVKANVVSSTNLSLIVSAPTGATYESFSVTSHDLTSYASHPFDITFPGGGVQFIENSFAGRMDFMAGSNLGEIRIADFDNDGKPDIVISREDTLSVYRNTTTNGVITFAERTDIDFGIHKKIEAFAVGDIDGDGRLDIVITTENNGNIANGFVLKNNSKTGSLSFAMATNFFTEDWTTQIAIGDLNNDGKPDIAICYGGLASISLYKNTTANGSISLNSMRLRLPEFISDDAFHSASISIRDFNNDGLRDLVIGSESNHFYILKNQSILDGFIFEALRKESYFSASLNYIASADFNLDGNPDLISTNYLFTGRDNFNFTASPISEIGGVTALGDLDGDGKPDYASIKYPFPSTIFVSRNNTLSNEISFDPNATYAAGSTPKNLAVGDLDGDGRPDIAFTRTGTVFSVLKNLVSALNICPNGNAMLSSNISGSSYQWQQNSGSGFSDINDNTHYSGNKTKNLQLKNIPVAWHGYRYRCIVDISDTSSVITLNIILPANAGVDTSICLGTNIQLLGSGGTSYSWSPSAGLNNSNIADPVASPLVTTTYTLTVSNDKGCVSKDSVIISVNSSSQANAGEDKSICVGSNIQLHGSGGDKYSWSPAVGLSSSNIAEPVASPLVTTVYTLVTSSGSCVSSDRITITVNTSKADAGEDTTICMGKSIQLYGSGGSKYSWLPVTGLSNPNIANPLASPDTTTLYILTVSNANNCASKDSVMVSVDSTISPLISITATTDDICLGNPVTFTASTSGSGTSPFYQWQVNEINVNTSSSTFTSSSLNNKDQVRVILTSNAVCAVPSTATSNTLTIRAQELALPQLSLDSRVFTVINADTAATYTWQTLKDTVWTNVVLLANGHTYAPSLNGEYRVLAVKGQCSEYSTSKTLNSAVAISDYFRIYLYPNPARNIITLDSIQLLQNWETLDILNTNGFKALPTVDIKNQTSVVVKINSLASGIYFVQLRRRDGVFTSIKLVKQ